MAIKIKKVEDINPQAEPELKPMPLKEDYEIDPSIPFVNKITANDYNTIVTNIETIHTTQKVVADNVDGAIDASNKAAKDIQDFYNGIKYTAFPRGNLTNEGDFPVEIGGDNVAQFVSDIYSSDQISSIYLGRFTLTTAGDNWPKGDADNSFNKTITAFPQMWTQGNKYEKGTEKWIEYTGMIENIGYQTSGLPLTNIHFFSATLRLLLDTSTNKVSMRFIWDNGQVKYYIDSSGVVQGSTLYWYQLNFRPGDWRETQVWIAKKQAINFNNINQG